MAARQAAGPMHHGSGKAEGGPRACEQHSNECPKVNVPPPNIRTQVDRLMHDAHQIAHQSCAALDHIAPLGTGPKGYGGPVLVSQVEGQCPGYESAAFLSAESFSQPNTDL